jgi:Zn-dependent alcohol dehydrogenase
MKAGVMYERHKPLVLDDVDLADPAANEVEVELVASGVCHSDLHHLERRPSPSGPSSTRTTLSRFARTRPSTWFA